MLAPMLRETAIAQTIILAAGHGSRLGTTDNAVPKPLTLVAGVPLIAHALEHARASGCQHAVIVIGYEGARIRSAVERLAPELRVTFVENPNSSAPNGVSLLTAEVAAEHTFFLQMVDHVFAGVALPKLAASPFSAGESGRLLVDRTPEGIDLDDATKVRTNGDRISAIDKGLTPWDAIDTGCFALTRDVFDALRRVPTPELSVTAGMRQLAACGALTAVDIGDLDWIDVDTPQDRDAAERLLSADLSLTRMP